MVVFKAILEDSHELKDAITTVASIVKDKCKFKIDNTGIHMNAMDPANIAMVIFDMFTPGFKEFNLKEDISITLDVEQLTTVLKRAKPSDQVILSFDPKENYFKIIFDGKSIRSFAIPLMSDIEEDEKNIPEMDFLATAEIKAEILKDGIDDASVVADNILLTATKNEFRMDAEGDMGKTSLKLTEESGALISIEADDKVSSRFTLDYLKKMIGGAKIASTVKLHLSNDYPVRLDFTEVDKVNLSFILAPRVSETP